jgi:hypothetical protein
MSNTLYSLLATNYGFETGPIHERVATIFEIVRGHTSVLAEFRRRPGRWFLWIEVDDAPCPDCGANSGRYIQFAFLEDCSSLIGECSASKNVHERLKFTPDQEDALRTLGWKDPVESRTPNWHVEAASNGEVIELGRMTERTLLEVFELELQDRAIIKFQGGFSIGRRSDASSSVS